ncbi:hypothetical protein [Flagellimonas meridianipacifica]|uniref:Uncharacterized protein n=1 Tax=Flagellimonas meridianipacifica TaxID=1080225 RepID=A0A2T0MER7_9FLAO|nr:hypothetical protein [Allomuricauda pacifica]PRX56071.1 hypothetical protein CLV81_0059 [Allomuricauda pacifica]
MVQRNLHFILIALLFFSQSCIDDDVDCAAVLCAGPPSIGLEILLDGENVFLNNTYIIDDVSLTGVTNNQIISSLFFDTVNENIVLVLTLTSVDSDFIQFDINLGGDFTIGLNLETFSPSPTGECCSGIPILEAVQINGEERDLATSPFIVNLN